MELKLQEVADLVGGKIIGDPGITLKNVAKIEEAQEGDLTFLYLSTYEKYLRETKASAVLIKPDAEKTCKTTNYIEVQNPNSAFNKVITHYFNPEIILEGIAPSAFVHPDAIIAENVSLGRNVVVSKGCIIGNNTKIFHNTVVMSNVSIGSDCVVYPNVTIGEECNIGKQVIIHSGTVIGSDGFGFIPNEKGEFQKYLK